MITVEIEQRGIALPRLLSNQLSWKVQRYSNRAIGGPHQAEIRITGPDLALWELLEMLRDKIRLRDEQGEFVWWGYISDVEVTAKNPNSPGNVKTRVGASIDSMYNRIAIAWEDIAAGTQAGPRMTTTWVQDDYSIAEFGTKEGLFSGASASDQTLAERARDTLLIRKKYPIAMIDLNVSGESFAVIRCRGWWDTLNWKQCSISAELALSYTAYNNWMSFGVTNYEQVAQGIVPTGGNINLSSIQIYVNKAGTITDDITVAIYTNPDDLTPTTLIQNGTAIDGATVTTAFQWLTSTFSPEVTLTSGTKYFIVIGRSGAVDDVNYFNLMVDTTGGYSGAFSRYDGAAWQTLAYSAIFRMYDNDIILTSTQALNILTAFGQFFPRVDSEVDSGVLSESYRDGDGTAHFEIEELLNHGTVRGRRMLAKVFIDRRCTIQEEDEDLSANYYSILADGTMLDNYGAQVRRQTAKAGVYARMVEAIPPNVDTSALGNTTKGFIEINEYDAVNDVNIYTWRDELDPFVVGRPLDG